MPPCPHLACRRGNNNIAETIFKQLEAERAPHPAWIIVSAGTGGTSATIGRFLHYHGAKTKLCVADPENSVFYDAWCSGDRSITLTKGSLVEGIGRPRVEESFLSQVWLHAGSTTGDRPLLCSDGARKEGNCMLCWYISRFVATGVINFPCMHLPACSLWTRWSRCPTWHRLPPCGV